MGDVGAVDDEEVAEEISVSKASRSFLREFDCFKA